MLDEREEEMTAPLKWRDREQADLIRGFDSATDAINALGRPDA